MNYLNADSFTVKEWRNKIFSDPRMRAQLKDRNYKIKIIEDVVLTRNATQKSLLEKIDVKISEEPISIGKDSVIFEGIVRSGIPDAVVVIKVWNKSGKELMESKRDQHEFDSTFMEEIQRMNSSEFSSIWPRYQYNLYEKLQNAGVAVPKPFFVHKNALVMEKVAGLSLHDCVGGHSRMLSEFNNSLMKSQRELWKLGLVFTNLNEHYISYTGVVYNGGDTIPNSNTNAHSILLANLQKFRNHYVENSFKDPKFRIPSTEDMFAEITGMEYKIPKSSQLSNFKNQDHEIRKYERKSERSALSKSLKN